MESSPSPDLFGDIAVDPVAPAAAWLGGKRNLSRTLVGLIDSERPRLEALHARLAGVTVECLGYGDFIARYDRPETLFYCDPPYWGGENDYGKGMFARDDFAALAAQLQAIKGRFILSINDRPEIRELFAFARFEEVEVTYTIGPDNSQAAKELIITSPVR